MKKFYKISLSVIVMLLCLLHDGFSQKRMHRNINDANAGYLCDIRQYWEFPDQITAYSGATYSVNKYTLDKVVLSQQDRDGQWEQVDEQNYFSSGTYEIWNNLESSYIGRIAKVKISAVAHYDSNPNIPTDNGEKLVTRTYNLYPMADITWEFDLIKLCAGNTAKINVRVGSGISIFDYDYWRNSVSVEGLNYHEELSLESLSFKKGEAIVEVRANDVKKGIKQIDFKDNIKLTSNRIPDKMWYQGWNSMSAENAVKFYPKIPDLMSGYYDKGDITKPSGVETFNEWVTFKMTKSLDKYSEIFQWTTTADYDETLYSGLKNKEYLVDFKPATTTEKIYLKTENHCYSKTHGYVEVQLKAEPLQASKPEGKTSVCGNGSNTTYTTSADYASSYTWDISPDSAGTISEGTVNWNNEYKGNVYIKAKGVNQYGSGSWSETLKVNVDNVPKKPNQPDGVNDICQDYGISEYTIPALDNATSYDWEIMPDTAASLNINGKSVQVEWSGDFYGQAEIKARGVNSCGNGEFSEALTINVNPTPVLLEDIKGDENICNTFEKQYVVSYKHANAYNWSLEPNEGNVIDNGNDTIKIDIDNSYEGEIKLKVQPSNYCGDGTQTTKTINVQGVYNVGDQLPIGNYDACQNDTNIFEISSVNEGIGYEYKVRPSHAYDTVINKQDTLGFVDWQDGYSGSAYVSYRVENRCGLGSYSNEREVTVNPLPGKASKPMGSVEVCQGSNEINYTTSGASEATGFDWKVIPDSAGSSSGNQEGVLVDFANDYNGKAKITVRGVNDCGVGEFSDTLEVTVKPLPEKPILVSDNSNICKGDSSIIEVSSNYATSYEFSLSEDVGEKISYKDTLEIIWNDSFTGQVEVKVRGKNDCGLGKWSENEIININSYPDVSLILNKAKFCPYDKAIELTGGKPLGGNYYVDGNVVDSIKPDNLDQGNHSLKYYYTDENNCQNWDSTGFYVDEIKAGFTSNVKEIQEGQKIEFYNNSVNANEMTWKFGDGSFTSHEENPDHYYYENGKYDVQLDIESKIGCKDSMIKENYVVVLNTNSDDGEDDSTETAINIISKKIRVYPNPARNNLKIDYEGSNMLNYSLYNIKGIKYKSGIIYQNKKTINVNGFEKGIYLLKIKNEQGEIITRKKIMVL